MSDHDTDGLIGRASQEQDQVDRRRLLTYHTFFGLDPLRDAPLAFHWFLFTQLAIDYRNDGQSRAASPLPDLSSYPRRMWGGGEIEWRGALVEGAVVDRLTRIVAAKARRGTRGDLLVVSLQRTIQLPDAGTQCIEERVDIVFLRSPARATRDPADNAQFQGDWSYARRATAVDLFQYSALTLNSHRIHYDRTYASEVEGYPNLLVQGPLLATQLMHEAARRRPDATPVRFMYRATAPVYCEEPYYLMGRKALDASEELAVVGSTGDVRMRASMKFLPADA